MEDALGLPMVLVMSIWADVSIIAPWVLQHGRLTVYPSTTPTCSGSTVSGPRMPTPLPPALPVVTAPPTLVSLTMSLPTTPTRTFA